VCMLLAEEVPLVLPLFINTATSVTI
jgi:hypothetical protein